MSIATRETSDRAVAVPNLPQLRGLEQYQQAMNELQEALQEAEDLIDVVVDLQMANMQLNQDTLVTRRELILTEQAHRAERNEAHKVKVESETRILQSKLAMRESLQNEINALNVQLKPFRDQVASREAEAERRRIIMERRRRI
jgi:hypothetical protein